MRAHRSRPDALQRLCLTPAWAEQWASPLSAGIDRQRKHLRVGTPDMCGRYDLSETPRRLIDHFGLDAAPDFPPDPDARPTTVQPVVRRAGSGARECALLRWGLVPYWAKELKFGAKCINARAETVASAPAFRDAFRRRRAIVPATAFYEWRGPPGHKIKYRIALADGSPMGFASLWERWHSPQGETVETFTILTGPPNEALAPIHDRMPVILLPEDYGRWLDADSQPPELLRPYPASAMRVASFG